MPQHPPRLLIIEDDSDTLDYLADLLGERYGVQAARDGEAGLCAAAGSARIP
jgi:DNA-binding response OmpR family regulator